MKGLGSHGRERQQPTEMASGPCTWDTMEVTWLCLNVHMGTRLLQLPVCTVPIVHYPCRLTGRSLLVEVVIRTRVKFLSEHTM